MREVSCRVTALVVESATHHSVDWGSCLEGLALTRESLVDTRQRIDWETCVALLERLEGEAGGPERFEALATMRASDAAGPSFVQLAQAFFAPVDLYRLFARWGITRDVSIAHGALQVLDAHRVRMTIALDATRIGSLPFFRFLAGVARHLPCLVGLPPASLVLHATPHEGVYDLVLPAPLGMMRRFRRAVSVAAGASATLDALEAQAREIRAKNEQLEAQLDEQRKAEAALREQQSWLDLALEAGRVRILIWDVKNDRAHWSAAASDDGSTSSAVGFPASFVAYLEHVHPDDRPELEGGLRRTLDGTGFTFENEHRVLQPDGAIGWMHAKARIGRDSEGAVVSMTGTLADVSERRRLETHLLFVDRMVSTGTIAAGVAHELNNPLAYMMTSVELIAQYLERAALTESDAAFLRRTLDAITDGGERMRLIMNDLRTFARPEEERRTDVDVARVIDASIRLVSNELRHRAQVELDYAADLPRVTANESRLGQVFTNLLVNAAHAIPDTTERAGVIRISTRTDPEGCVVVMIEDNGSGMSPATLRRLFEPFFTTKAIGSGTGLGLAVCQNLVSALGGRIDVESELGRGATFRVVLPASKAHPVVPEQPCPSPTPTGGRILIIDDKPTLRASLKSLLDREGFITRTAESAEQGLALALAETFDVVLCDLMMPGKTGMDVHAELERVRPDIARHMIFLTGGAFTPRAAKFLENVGNPRIDKPFRLAQLVTAIEAMKARP